jgi:DNA-binding response OmpR family regulator
MNTSGDEIVEVSPQAGILLVESDQHLLNSRSLLLTKSDFRVFRAGNACDVYHLRSVPMVSVAVLSNTLGDSGLRAAAECVREQWSTARILILGEVQTSFEDYLYDEALDCRFQPYELLKAISKLCRSSQLVGYWTPADTPKPSMHQDQCRAVLPAMPPERDWKKKGCSSLSLDTSLNARASCRVRMIE